jgi:ADP-heptose:LPS heptosyltransferase
MSQMDLIITVDTSVAHLAGALGLKTWLILPYVSDYRWGLEANTSPWYDNITIFRQSFPGEWGKPLNAVSSLLAQFS